MRFAILDPASGIAGDMFLGALVDVGLDRNWLQNLPSVLGLDGVAVRIADVLRAGVKCVKVDFEIPPQPHGRPVSEIHRIIDTAQLPTRVSKRAHDAFDAIATVESAVHGVTTDELHLHEIGSIDAILDVVGVVWGIELLGIQRVYNTGVSLGDGTVKTAHGILPVPAPATIRLLEGFQVRHGPPDCGELTTPTGAALVRILSIGPPPGEYTPRLSGYGAGTREIHGRLNALRIILGESEFAHDERRSTHPSTEHLHVLSADIDDMSPEDLAGAAETLRSEGALDVVMIHTLMKKGRPGTRIEALVTAVDLNRIETSVLQRFTTLGVRRSDIVRKALHRESQTVQFEGQDVTVKVARLPDGSRRVKPEFDDLRRISEETSHPIQEVRAEVLKLFGAAFRNAGVQE